MAVLKMMVAIPPHRKKFKAAQTGGRPVGLLLAAAFVAASCVLFILSWNGIL